jgi:hypothetical protein
MDGHVITRGALPDFWAWLPIIYGPKQGLASASRGNLSVIVHVFTGEVVWTFSRIRDGATSLSDQEIHRVFVDMLVKNLDWSGVVGMSHVLHRRRVFSHAHSWFDHAVAMKTPLEQIALATRCLNESVRLGRD